MHRHQPLPRLWMMTDERQGEGLFAALDRLPRGAGIVFRHYSLDPAARRELFDRVKPLARAGDLLLMLGGPLGLAAAWGADGSHGPAPGRMPGLLKSASVHNLAELKAAERARADFIFISPVFPTRSHPGAPALGPEGFGALARETKLPAIALGGMNADRARALDGLNLYGWAAIDAWNVETSA